MGLLRHFANTALVAMLLMPHLCLAKGGDSGGGGDLMLFRNQPIRARQYPRSSVEINLIRNYIKSGLKIDLVRWIKTISPQEVDLIGSTLGRDFDYLKEILTKHPEKFINDIVHSPYYISEFPVFPECGPASERSNEKDAATCGNLGDTVRFNIEHISNYDLPWSTSGLYSLVRHEYQERGLKAALIQLAFHEHCRHFRSHDANGELGRRALTASTSKSKRIAQLEVMNRCTRVLPLARGYDRRFLASLFTIVQATIARCNKIPSTSVGMKTVVADCNLSHTLGHELRFNQGEFLLPPITHWTLQSALTAAYQDNWKRERFLDGYSLLVSILKSIELECR